jgi:hypothetical protein
MSNAAPGGAIYSREEGCGDLSGHGGKRDTSPAEGRLAGWLLTARRRERAAAFNAGGDGTGRRGRRGLTVAARASQCGDGVAAGEGISGEGEGSGGARCQPGTMSACLDNAWLR